MTLTPADVHNVAFTKAPIGKRGYTEEEVDVFLDLVEAELARLIEENNDLRNQVAQIDQQLRAASVGTGGNLRPLEPPRPVTGSAAQPPRVKQTSPGGSHHVQTVKVLGLAQEIADRLTGEAKAEADGMLSTAQAQAKKLLFDAKTKTDGMVNEARARAETMVDEARTRAEALDRQAHEKATSLERDAARKYTEIIDSISREKNLLERKISELRTFESEYHARLKIYLESQLSTLDPHVYTAPAGVPDQQSFGTHRADRKVEYPEVDHHIPVARNGTSGRATNDESSTDEIRWKPAVEPDRAGLQDVMDPSATIQRSVS